MSVDYSFFEEDDLGNEDYLIPLFSVPLFHFKVENWDEKKKELLKLYDERKKSKHFRRGDNAHSLDVETDYHSNYDNDFDYSDKITDIFEDELISFADATGLEVSICSTWFERATKNKNHTCHNHGPIGYSAVCFIQFDPKHHTPTVFMNPITASTQSCSLMPPGIREGSLIMFPSYLLHYTNSNESDMDRIILSFNMETPEHEHHKFSEEKEEDGEYYTTTA